MAVGTDDDLDSAVPLPISRVTCRTESGRRWRPDSILLAGPDRPTFLAEMVGIRQDVSRALVQFGPAGNSQTDLASTRPDQSVPVIYSNPKYDVTPASRFAVATEARINPITRLTTLAPLFPISLLIGPASSIMP